MPTIRLIPSSYSSSHSSYASISSGAANMYNNTDHTSNYASLRGRNQNSTNAYYIFIKGFNFDDVPLAAVVSSFEVKIRCYRNSYQRTGANYRLRLASADSFSDVIGNTTISSDITTSAAVYSIPTGNLTWSQLKSYGDDFSIVVPLSSTSSSRPYVYVYGAEISVTYSLPNPRTVTTTLNGDGTIDPSGTETYYDGDEYSLTITPTDTSETVTVTKNGVDVTSSVIGRSDSTTASAVLGAYTLVSGSFNGSGASYFQGIVGHGVNASTTTSNYYSSGSGSTAVFTYAMGFNIPSNAIIERVYCEVNGHAESTSSSSEYMCVQLRSGGTDLSEEINFKNIGTSNTTITLECETLPTVNQLSNMVLECTLGYYGGAINGATAYVVYSLPSEHPSYYTYTYTIDGDAAIIVTIGSTNKLFIKVNGSWKEVDKVYKKINGQWVEQTDLETIFDINTNYMHA